MKTSIYIVFVIATKHLHKTIKVMRGAYKAENLKGLKEGDEVKVKEVWKQSERQLTKGKTYKVVDIQIKGYGAYEQEQFCIITDTGLKRWYYFKNRMFRLHSKAKPYNEEQVELLREYTRGIEALVQSWNQLEGDPDRDKLYETDRDSMIDEYLEKLNLARD